MSEDVSEAMQAVRKARARLLISNPFFGALAMHLHVHEWTPETVPWYIGENKTMAVDGHTMYFWPEWVLSKTEDQLKGVVAHEILHCAYRHFSRRGQRNPQIWNCAGDYVINHDLHEAGFELPNPHLHDVKYAGMGTEEVYDLIVTDLMKNAPQDGTIDDKGGCGIVLDAGTSPGKQGQKGQHDAPDVGKADQADRDWEINVRAAVEEQKRRNAGQLPGFLQRLVNQMNEPKVDWKTLTQQWVDGVMSREPSWARPNRRFAHLGQYWPGWIADSLNHLVMCIDVSGSISNELMIEMVSEGAGALENRVCDRLTVIYADDGVRQVDDFSVGDDVEARTMGGGGTSFKDTFEWIGKNTPDASAIIYLTDGETCSWGEDLGIPTLWALYNSYERVLHLEPPFGSPIHVSNTY